MHSEILINVTLLLGDGTQGFKQGFLIYQGEGVYGLLRSIDMWHYRWNRVNPKMCDYVDGLAITVDGVEVTDFSAPFLDNSSVVIQYKPLE